MHRLSLSTRIGLIVILGMLILWFWLIALAYWSDDLAPSADLPRPARIAALADLIERTPEPDRVGLLQIINAATTTARIEAAPEAKPMQRDLRESDPAKSAPYITALGDRLLAMLSPPTSLLERRAPRLIARALNAVEFQIALASGDVLVIESRSPFVAVTSGLPIGYGAGLIGTMIALVTLLALHREIRSLTRLAEAVDRLEIAGDPDPLPKIRSRAPETRALTGAFARLQDRLSTMLRGRMALIGGIQHDVRTFATRLRLRVDQIPDSDERERAVTDIADMIDLLDDAMLASRTGADELDQELLELAAIVRADIADRRAAGAPVHLDVDDDAETATLLGDRLALRRITANLIDNALKYGHVAHVTVSADADAITLTVDDEGPGIPTEKRALLLEPFVRLEPSRARRSGGAGLGLAIVRTLVEAHQGVVTIDNAPTGGARLAVRLPVFHQGQPGQM